MPRGRNDSPQTRLILGALLGRTDAWSYGYELSKETGVGASTLYPILIRLQRQGWLETNWSDAVPGRPPRHLYKLTPEGAKQATAALEAAANRARRKHDGSVGEAGLGAT